MTLQFSNVIDFVNEVVARTYRRKLQDKNTVAWCEEWWRHPEAVMRLEGMWLAWEQARTAPDGISSWMLHHADPHMSILLSQEHGPFWQCKQGHKAGERPLPTTPPTSLRSLRAARMAPSTSAAPEDSALVEGYEQQIAELHATIAAQAAHIRNLGG